MRGNKAGSVSTTKPDYTEEEDGVMEQVMAEEDLMVFDNEEQTLIDVQPFAMSEDYEGRLHW
jgi:hypothetical protein